MRDAMRRTLTRAGLLLRRRMDRCDGPRFEPVEPRLLLSGSPVISEFMAVNDSTLMDEDGAFSDWIELHNPTDQSFNLAGWHLTDNAADLDKWTFPAVTLEPGQFMVVFASDKNRTNPASQLHTNFRLTGDGEYLALVRPDLTVAHAYDPAFPSQEGDVSFGVLFDGANLLAAGSAVDLLVPTDDSLGLTWTQRLFELDEEQWFSGSLGVGYGLSSPGFTVRDVKKAGGTISTLGEVDALLALTSPNAGIASETTAITPVINFFDTGGDGRFTANLPFPNDAVNNFADYDDFAIHARGTIIIPPGQGGQWTFGINSDDGARLLIDGNSVIFDNTLHGPRDTFGYVTLSEGPHDIDLVMFERGGGAEVELFAAFGFHFQFVSQMRLVGDTANGGLAVFTTPGSGGASPVQVLTDVQTQMKGVNSSIFIRAPFIIDDVNEIDALTLSMHYNDGFVAYLNGVEVASRNAPASRPYNAAATAERSVAATFTAESINLTPFVGQLVDGLNVLAIHAMNDGVNDDNFLAMPKLTASGVLASDPRYFATPTPGGPNSSDYFGVVGDTKFSVDRGFYDAPFQVAITSDTNGAEIRYTTNGSAPTLTNGTVYTGPITINTTTTLRAAAFLPGFRSSDVDTQTYIFLDHVMLQPNNPAGFPSTWGSVAADYEVDPDVVNNPLYNATFKSDLMSIPTMSLVMNVNELFGPSGIYSNSTASGVAWERAGSIEYFDPATGEQFQVNAGVRMHGGASRNAGFLKHNFRLLFKEQYGPTKLQFPLFGEDAVDEFDSIILRAGFNNSWLIGGGESNQAEYMRDEWMRRTLLEMGRAASHGTFVHLYVNGLYWGLYNPVERPNADFASSYFGGEKEQWDVLNSGEAIDGNTTSWNTAMNIANAGVADQAGYDALAQYVDIPNLIDYMIVNFYGGNLDWDSHNWYAGRLREPSEGFKFFSWDAERVLESVTVNRIDQNLNGQPSRLYSALRANPLFRQQFADRAHELLFNGGPLSPERTRARFEELAAFIDRAIVGESARWGDKTRATPYTRNVEWLTEVNRILNQYFPQRSAVLVSQLRGGGLYPAIDAPWFSQHGGAIEDGFELFIGVPNGTVYYTLDGSDPRMPDGSLNPNAVIYDGVPVNTSLINAGAVWKYLDNGSDQGTAWRQAGFSDAAWASGPAELGYGDGDEATIVSFGPNSGNKYRTTYFRRLFSVTGAEQFDSLTLRLKRDDGAIVYINGVEVARSNMPSGAVDYQTFAATVVPDEGAFVTFSIDPSVLVEGVNTIAVEVHQANAGSSDLSFDLSLDGTALPTGSGVDLTQSGEVKARALQGGVWSALNHAYFTLNPADATTLAVTEVNYGPHDLTDAEAAVNPGFSAGDFEFIEFRNVSGGTIDLTGVSITAGVRFTFGHVTLEPGQYVVVVSNADAFALRYGGGVNVAGEFESGSLDNAGETITVTGLDGSIIASFVYDNGGAFPEGADGQGRSLEAVGTGLDLSNGASWRVSYELGGSPGVTGAGPRGDVVINELLTHTDLPQVDAIELHNTTGLAIDLGGWYLSDGRSNLRKFEIPAGTVIAAGGYVVFDEDDFNAQMGMGPNDFALDGAHGETVYLMAPTGSGTGLGFADQVTFGAAANGESFGRSPNGTGPLGPMAAVTLNAANSAVRVGPIVISEVMYNPPDPGVAGVDANDLEFIEIHNPTSQTVDLSGWTISGVDFAFDNSVPRTTSIGPGQTLVLVGFNPTSGGNALTLSTFRSVYGIGLSVPIIGNYGGRLDNGGERIVLYRPDEPPADEPNFTPRLIVDEADYDDVSPWPTAADGGGSSLTRGGIGLFGRLASSWSAATPTPGSVDFGPAGDVNGDGVVDHLDIDDVFAAINAGSTDPRYDLDDSGAVDTGDADHLVRVLLGTEYGDVNLDRRVNITDLSQLAARFGQSGTGWSGGDFNGDGVTNITDLSALALRFGFDNSGGGGGGGEASVDVLAEADGPRRRAVVVAPGAGVGSGASSPDASWRHIASVLDV